MKKFKCVQKKSLQSLKTTLLKSIEWCGMIVSKDGDYSSAPSLCEPLSMRCGVHFSTLMNAGQAQDFFDPWNVAGIPFFGF
jgi:hypothetical protein